MDKLKNILRPGKGVDDETLYSSSGHGTNPVMDRLQGGSNEGGLQSSSTSPPKPFSTGGDEKTSPVETRDHASTTQQATDPSATTSNTLSGKDEASQADANLLATREADKMSTAETEKSTTTGASSTLRPEYPTPASAGSNASIKSNVVGRVPTGSGLLQDQDDLPKVPATDGKFMNSETPTKETLAAQSGVPSSDQSFPLAGSTSTGIGSQTASSPHQTQLANRLDPNLATASQATSQGDKARSTTTEDSHLGRNTAIAGATAATGAGAYAASKHHEESQTGSNPLTSSTTVGSDDARIAAMSAPTTTSTPATSSLRPTAATVSRPSDDGRLRHMPGAYPETPRNESEKMLGSDAAGVGSGAAVLAAQKAYSKHNDDQAPASKPPVVAADPTPYNAGVDPRVDPTDRQTNARTAAGLATATGAATTAGALSHDHSSRPQGTFGEKIQDAQARDETREQTPAFAAATTASKGSQPQGTFAEKIEDAQAKDDSSNNKKYALAGAAAAATGAGAYGVAKHQQRDETIAPATEPFPTMKEQTAMPTKGDNIPESTAGMATTTQATARPGNDEREFPLAGPDERSTAAKTTNFSYPTGAKEVAAEPQEQAISRDRSIPKDAAETGAAGAGGVAAYEALKHHEGPKSAGRSTDIDDPLSSRAHPKALEGYDDQRALPSHDSHVTGHEPSQVEAASSHNDRDRDRNAALAGASILGGGAAAGALASRDPTDDKLEKERAKVAEQKHAEHEKHARKSSDKTRKSEDKARRSEERHRRPSDEKEHKHGLIHRILHRHKSKESLDKENEARASPEPSKSSLDRSSYEQSASPVAAQSSEKYGSQTDDQLAERSDLQNTDRTGAESPLDSNNSTPEHSKHSGRNRLHKDPPPGFYDKQ